MKKEFLLKEYNQCKRNTENIFNAIAILTENNIAVMRLVDLYAQHRIEEEDILSKLEQYGINNDTDAIYEGLRVV